MRRQPLLGAIFLPAILSIPLFASPGQNERRDAKLDTVYDADHKDYHVWDENEQHIYRQFWQIHHRKYRDYSKLNAREVSHYWNWRHSAAGRLIARQ